MLGLHQCIRLSNPLNKEEKHNRERRRKISSHRSETQSEQPELLSSPLAAAAPASPAHVAPRNSSQAPQLPRSRCQLPTPARQYAAYKYPRERQSAAVTASGCLGCLFPLSLLIPLDKRCWSRGSLGGSRLRWKSSFRKNTCLKKSGVNKATSVCTHVQCYTCNNVLDTLLNTKFSLPFQDLRWHHELFLWT